MPKETTKKSSTKAAKAANRHAPLGQVIVDAENASKYVQRSSVKAGASMDTGDSDEEGADEFLDKKASTRILQMGKEQVEEEEVARFAKGGEGKKEMMRAKESAKLAKKPAAKRSSGNADSSEEEEDEDEEDDEDADDVDESGFPLFRTVRGADGYVDVEGAGVSASEEAVLTTLMGAGSVPRRTLADVIMGKIAAKEQGIKEAREVHFDEDDEEEDQQQEEAPMFPQKVIDVYTEIGTILQRYTAGKLPKAFKVIPSLKQWEDVLYLTRPDQWSPQAMYQATRIFASNLNPRMAQRFFNLVLLDSVRADIHRHKKLNYHYYASLKKALYKPAAFFKGILLPLSRDDCTLREAAIVSSVLSKCSIPVQHAAVALHKLAGNSSYSGGSAVFIKALLDKKYSLPLPVVSALVGYFCQGAEGEEKRPGLAAAMGTDQGSSMPVLWHQALLVFAQRYKDAINPDEKERLRIACRVHFHHQITKEVRRELFGLKGWKNDFGEGGDEMDM